MTLHKIQIIALYSVRMVVASKDIVLVVSLLLSVISLVLLFGVTWHFQSSLDLLQQEAEYDRKVLFKLQKLIEVRYNLISYKQEI